MSLYIPRLEWNDQSVTATRSNGNPVLSSISSTAGINAGMIASGTGIPSGATVISKTVNSVTLSEGALSSGTSVVNFVERIDFDYPPTEDTEEEFKPKQTVTASLSGLRQYVTDYLEATRSVQLGFLTQAVADKLRDNFYLYAYVGGSFRWYPDKALAGFQTYELAKFEFSRDRQVKKHPSFLYALKLDFRRVV
jgi:hypothetical protein